ncbi:hypothetical protein ACLOJK_034696 [Asimina triloba]
MTSNPSETNCYVVNGVRAPTSWGVERSKEDPNGEAYLPRGKRKAYVVVVKGSSLGWEARLYDRLGRGHVNVTMLRVAFDYMVLEMGYDLVTIPRRGHDAELVCVVGRY